MTVRQISRRAASLRRQLSQRELAVLASLEQLRLLTTAHIQRLHLIDGSDASNTRRTQYLLKRLHHLKLVVRLSRIIGGVRAGSAGVVYGISGLGVAVLLGTDHARRRRVWETKPYFQDHMLAVSGLYVALVQAQRTHPDIEVLSFGAEPAAWRRFTGVGGELVILKPDAVAQVGIGDLVLTAFVEADLGTESLPTIYGKCLRYLAYWNSGLEQQRHGVFPLVVWLVPDDHRRNNIAQVIDRLSPDAARLFTVALFQDGPTVITTIPGAPEGTTAPRAPP
jgi:hypothetical protein